MKQVRFLATSFAASMLMLLSSCNSSDDKKTEETTTNTATETTTAPDKAPETTATPKLSNAMVMQFKVADFAKWQSKYELKERDSIRRASGLSNYVVGRGLDDPNKVIVFLKMEDANKAKELTGSQGMKDRMKEAGVTGTPTFNYVEVVMDDNSRIEQTNRLMMTHKLKDWDAFKNEFDKHKQVRLDAGLIDRAIGHPIDDPHEAILVFAVTDMAKAKAFLQSKDLKDKMEKAGVEGKPTSFFYNIEKMYQ
jgi:protein-disulfide isomerase